MLKKMLRGAAGGLAGTVAHTAVMLGARKAGLVGDLPPKRITDEMLASIGVDPEEDTRIALAVANHVGFGLTTGALFGAVMPRMSRPTSMLAGAAYGLAVWFVSYEGWVPRALGALPPAHRDRWDRQAVLMGAHVAFGLALGAVAGRRRPRDKGDGVAPEPRLADGSKRTYISSRSDRSQITES